MTEKELYEEQQYEDVEELAIYQTFDGYQDWTDSTAIFPKDKALEYLALGLVSEAGEVAGKVKKLIRDGYDDDKLEAIEGELGDCLWYLAQMASELDVFLSDIVQEHVQKLESRKKRGVLGGSGDNR